MINDPYVYPNSNVLKNKAKIKNQEELEIFETNIVTLRLIAIKKQKITITSIYDILKIHKFLFSPIYTWAGKIRTITIYKKEPILEGYSVDYTPHDYIKQEMDDLERKYNLISWADINHIDKIKYIVSIIQELWQIHCFREGNTRTIAIFLYFLLKQNGFNFNLTHLQENAKYFRNALVLSSLYSRSKKEYLEGLILDLISYKKDNKTQYSTINGYSISKYVYSNHTIEQVKVIKDFFDL